MLRSVVVWLLTFLLLVGVPAMPAQAQQATPVGTSVTFSDLTHHWAAPLVLPLALSGIVQGFPDGTFRPDDPANRLEATLIFSRALELQAEATELPYSDLDLIPHWARGQVAAATPLIAGVPDSRGNIRFLPYGQLTRAQLAVMAHRGLELMGHQHHPATDEDQITGYRDGSQVPDWARASFGMVLAAGILQGDDTGKLLPLRVATRAEVAAVVLRLLQQVNPHRFPPLTGSPNHPGHGEGLGGVGDGADPGGDAPPAAPHREVVGYYARSGINDKRALESLRQNGHIMSAVAEAGFYVDWSGQVRGQPHTEMIQEARSQGLSVLAVIGNDAGHGFDRGLVHHILNTEEVTETTIRSIVGFLVQHGYDGLNLDFENVAPADRWALSSFASRLAENLRAKGLIFSMAVPAKTSDDVQHQWSGAFDYSTLGKLADALVPMGYDEHWFGGPAGPVASLPWVQNILSYATKTLDSSRVWLGVPAYGYQWSAAGTGRAFPGRDGLSVATGAGVAVQWDDVAQVPFFIHYKNGQRLISYYENAHSLRPKLAAADAHGVSGVALWRLGYEDPAIWPLLERYRNGQSLIAN